MGLGISSVGIPEISPYTKYEQSKIAGKHLTRHAKNGYSVVDPLRTLASLFFEGRSATACAVARYLTLNSLVIKVSSKLPGH